jgi:PKD repeat protein
MKINNIKKTIFVYFLTLLVSFSLYGFIGESEIKYQVMNANVIKRLDDGAFYTKNKIILKFKNEISGIGIKSFGIQKLDNVVSKFNPIEVKQIYPLNSKKQFKGDNELAKIFYISYDYDIDPTDISKAILSGNEDILDWVEPDYVCTLDFVPNDPSIGSQWHISKISSYTAWDITQGDTSVVIGMVDSGSDLDHPDLNTNIKFNYLENPTNGIDDDGNGYIDDWRGWDFAGANYQALSQDNDPNVFGSNCDHGSHTSGCASEVTNNAVGGAGIGFKCKLLISKHGADNDYTGTGGVSYMYNTNQGIVYCYQNNAKVINCSFGSSSYSSYTQLVVSNAWSNGSVIVASAGNDGSNVARYPASYTNVVSVAATNSSDQKAWFSNYHSTVDICAPGQSIYSTLWNNTYVSYDGTSMSSPITAGAVALIWSKFPTYTPDAVVNKLLAGVDDISGINPGYTGLLGSGRLNAYKCVLSTGLQANFTSNVTNIIPGGNVSFTDQSTGSPTSWAWQFPGGNPSTSTAQNPTNIVYNTAGTYNVTLTVYNGGNNNSITKNNYITVSQGSSTVLNESFENTTFPPTGWVKLSPITGATGWNRQTAGTTPVPGFNGGYITTPANGGNAVAFCNFITGNASGGVSGPSDQWLVTPQITNVQPGDSLIFWLRKFGTYIENFNVKISTTTPTIAAMTTAVMTQNFPAADSGWVQYKYKIGTLVPTGSNIYIGFREWVTDVANDGASFSLDLVSVSRVNVGITSFNQELPSTFSLNQNYPNPFNPTTNIQFGLPRNSNVKLIVFDMAGKQISVLLDEYKQAGSYTYSFDGSQLSSGVYFYRIIAGNFVETRKMLLIK